MSELQRADMWKRMSAGLLDFILLVMVAVGMAFLMTMVLNYDERAGELEALSAAYETEYGVKFDLSTEEYNALTEAERETYDKAYEAFTKDEEANRIYGLLFNMTLVIISVGVLAAVLLMELLIPLLLGNGQTIGKKVFAIGVMRIDGIKLPTLLLFVRTVLGKYAVEIMIPVYICIMLIFGMMGGIGLILLLGLLVIQIVLIATSRTRAPIHDRLAQTVTVDFSSQRIFDSVEAREEYLSRIRAEADSTQAD